ncbi:MAG: sugar ABC transporter substrate-binding protein [Acetivibrionales bacterium]|jgi:ribose transport system substrate-binding protein
MKRKSLLIYCLVLALMFTMFAGCSSSKSPAQSGQPSNSSAPSSSSTPDNSSGKKEYNFVYIPKSVHEFYNLIHEGVDTAIAELGQKGIKVNLTWSAAPTADSAKQADLLEQAIAMKPDAIAIAVIEGSMCKELMEKAIEQGIVVIAFDTDFAGSPRMAAVGAGEKNMRLCGANLVDMTVEGMGTDKAEIAVLTGSPSAENHKIIVKGVEDHVKENYPDIKIVTMQADNDQLEAATQITENILSQYPNVKGIIGVTSSNGLGAAKAYEAAVAAGKYKIGDITIVDKTLTQEKKETMIPPGYLYGVQDCPPTMMGYYSVMMLNAYLTNKTPFQDIYLEYQPVTKENLDTFSVDYRTKYQHMEYWNK